jgi:hypothetical protein
MSPRWRRNGFAGSNPPDSRSSGGSSRMGRGEIRTRACPIGNLQWRVRSLAERTMTLEMLEDELPRPAAEDCELMRSIEGDVIVLGAGGKMGPSLARRARRAADQTGRPSRRIFAVSRFASEESRKQLTALGIEAISCDLLDRTQLARLPACANVLFLAFQLPTNGRGDCLDCKNPVAQTRPLDKGNANRMNYQSGETNIAGIVSAWQTPT